MSDTEYISKDAFITQQRKQYCVNCERRKGTKNGKRIFVYEIGEAPCRACDIGDMIDAVWDFQPADVAPVDLAHWIQANDIDETAWRCSKCDLTWILNEGTPSQNEMRYCPKCGAYMIESEDNE